MSRRLGETTLPDGQVYMIDLDQDISLFLNDYKACDIVRSIESVITQAANDSSRSETLKISDENGLEVIKMDSHSPYEKDREVHYSIQVLKFISTRKV